MAKTYEWCKDLPVVDYKNEEGHEYCVFHAPQGKKEVSVEKFNELIFEEINKAKRFGILCDLEGTIFEGDISFTQFDKNNPLPEISFFKTTFNGEVDFEGVTFNGVADLARAEFSGWADFSDATFNEITDFSDAIFVEYGSFYHATFNKGISFFGETFIKGGSFIGLNLKEKAKFEYSNLKKVSFEDTDLRKIDFINCTWPKRLGRNVLYDEIRLFTTYKNNDTVETSEEKKAFWDRLNHRFKQEWAVFKKDLYFGKDYIKKAEILYQQLKQKYKEEHNEPEVSNWHYGEKEMYRKSSRFRRFFPFSLSNLYWLSSGYGERPLRAGLMFLFLILTISVLFGLAGLDPNPTLNGNPAYKIAEIKSLTDIFQHFTGLIANTLQYATFEKEPDFMPTNIYGAFLKIVAKVFIPLQAALFVLAVRNKFRR